MELLQIVNVVVLVVNSVVIFFTVYELTKIKQQISKLKHNLIETKSQIEILEEAVKKAINAVLSLQQKQKTNNKVFTDADIEKLKKAI